MTTAEITVGVDVGGTSVRTVAYDSLGSQLRHRARPSPRAPDELVELLAAEVGAVREAGERCRHVGIGVPGRAPDGRVVERAVNLEVREPLDLAGYLEDRLATAVRVENDTNAAAVGHVVANPGLGSIAFLSIGTGLAAGVVLDGELVRGSQADAGEIGHLSVPFASDLCACGRRGCLETILSGRALAAEAKRLGIGDGAADVWDAARVGHGGADAVRTRTVDALAWACELLFATIDVEAVVIGGGVSGLGDRLVDPVRERLVHATMGSAVGATWPDRILLAAPDSRFGALGADRLARRWWTAR